MHPYIAKMEQVAAGEGQVALFWLGQAGFAIKGAGKTAYIDPYLSDLCGAQHRILPLPMSPGDVTNADVALATHRHDDHYDKLTMPGLMKASPQARLVLAAKAKELVAGTLLYGALERVVPISAGETVRFGELAITAVPAMHERRVDSEGCENLGYILDFGGVTVYHTGDSLYWPEMAFEVSSLLNGRRLDILLVPINGKWGNMTHEEAVTLAAELRPHLTIPMHYGTLSNNTVSPALFTDRASMLYPDLRWHVMTPGGPYVYSR